MVLDPGPEEPSGLVSELSRAAREVRRGARRRRIRRGLEVALFALAAATLTAEGGLRMAGDRRRAVERALQGVHPRWTALSRSGVFESLPDPVLRYALRPGARCEVDGWVFRVSQHRTRGPDFPLEKPPAERRLLVLGDSYAFGMWCDEDETLAYRLAQRANEREVERNSGVTWRPIVLAAPGYHARQQTLAFERFGLRLAPDVVVLYSNTNDIETAGFFYDATWGVLYRDFLPLPTRLRRVLWRWSHLYGWIARRHARAVDAGPTPHLDPRVPYAHVRADNQEATRAAWSELARTCREAGIRLFVVHQPLLSYLGDARRADWPVLPLVEWEEQVRRDLGVEGLALTGFARGYADNRDRFASGAPPDFLLDTYYADPRIQDAVERARTRALRDGRAWEALSLSDQVRYFEGLGGELPPAPDFHLTGRGYAHIARIVAPALEEVGFLP